MSIAGYDRSLPGFDRYTVIGEDSSGVFSLQIVNANLTDDAVYECQVGPAPANKPIRASSKLNVLRKFDHYFNQICVDINFYLVAPTKIELSGLHPGRRLEVNEMEEVELRCIVHDARPKAHIVWFRQNMEYKPGKEARK